MGDKLNEIDGRLRAVEIDVATIKERLTHLPTTAQLWRALAIAGGATLAAILGGGWWAVQTYLQPLLSAVGK